MITISTDTTQVYPQEPRGDTTSTTPPERLATLLGLVREGSKGYNTPNWRYPFLDLIPFITGVWPQ